MDDFSIREATTSDKEGVLGIHDNVYEGSDYLPVYYGHFVSSPDITPFVLLHKDKIVSTTYYNLSLMDGCMTYDFTSFSTVFQSYQDDGRLIMKGCVQWSPVYG